MRQIQKIVSRAQQPHSTRHFDRVAIRIVEHPVRVETKRFFGLLPVPAYGIGGHLAFLPINGQKQAALPYLGCQKHAKALAFQLQAQALQMGELAQSIDNVFYGLGLAFRRRVAPTGIGLQGSQVLYIGKVLILRYEHMRAEVLLSLCSRCRIGDSLCCECRAGESSCRGRGIWEGLCGRGRIGESRRSRCSGWNGRRFWCGTS